tara:strand:- start:1488 stop:1742 length:255 start_codon:yes stop_codon:yes gene_type:complete
MEETIRFNFDTKNINIKQHKFNKFNKINKINNNLFNSFCSKLNTNFEQIYSSSPNVSNEKFWPPPTNYKKNKNIITYLMLKLQN